MEMQFDKNPVAYLQKLSGGLRSQEQTLEVRLSDGMPDIGRVLGAWGQVIVRGKEWSNDAMTVSCGVMAWVLYAPEDEDGIRCVDAWLPFSVKWDLPDTRRDGKILVSCLLKSVDARSTSARKLLIRTDLDILGQAWQTTQAQVAFPCDLPEDVQILKATYPVLLPREAGEKAFLLEDQINPPATGQKPKKLIYYTMRPEVLDQKVMAGKVVFRGNGALHVLYEGDDGRLYTWDVDLPFSQYADLEEEYEQEAMVRAQPCVTSLDVAVNEDGSLQVKAGILGQFVLCDRSMVTTMEDAYSPRRDVKIMQEQLELPAILEQNTQTISAEQNIPVEARQIVDIAFCPAYSQWERTDTGARMPLPGQFQMLYYDDNDELRSAVAPWTGEWSTNMSHDSLLENRIAPVGKSQASPGAGSVNLRGEMQLETTISVGQGIPMVTGMELGETEKPDPGRPSLILRRKGDQRLWDIAKNTGSTVEAIWEANHLETEPEDGRVLLIPVM